MKAIPLTQGKIAIVDDEDFDKIINYPHPWRTEQNRNSLYAISINEKGSTVRLHRLIMNAQKGDEIDHINHDGLDNRKSNLRFVSNRQNHWNAYKREKATSLYKGVFWNTVRGRWNAVICAPNEIYLGLYYNETIAAWAYDQAAKRLFGEYARLNLPAFKQC